MESVIYYAQVRFHSLLVYFSHRLSPTSSPYLFTTIYRPLNFSPFTLSYQLSLPFLPNIRRISSLPPFIWLGVLKLCA
jgi:hypothetical protein